MGIDNSEKEEIVDGGDLKNRGGHPVASVVLAYDDFTGSDQVPLIDLAALHLQDREKAISDIEEDEVCKSIVGKMVAASRKWGIFQIINHGVPQGVVERCRAMTASLFALPMEKKMKAKRQNDGNFHGYGSGTSSMTSNLKDAWGEAFYLMEPPQAGDSAYYAAKIWGSDGNPEFRDGYQEYMTAMRKLHVQLLELLMVHGLGVHPEKVLEYVSKPAGSQGAMRLNFYKPCPEPTNHLGLPRHTDITIITILHQNTADVGGLQVEMIKDDVGGGKGRLVTVKPRADAFCVFIGDYGQALSNGLYKAPRHLAAVNNSKSRITMVSFLIPPKSLPVEPAPELINEKHPCLYKPFTVDDYNKARSETLVDALTHLSLNSSQ